MKRGLIALCFIFLFIFLLPPCSAPHAALERADVHVFGLPDPVPVVPNRKTGSPHWYYTVRFQETNGVGLEINGVWRYVNINGYPVLESEYDAGTVAGWFGSARVKGYGMLEFSSGRPVENGVLGEAYLLQCTDDRGNHAEFYGKIDFSMDPPPEPPSDPLYDTQNLRHKGEFEVPVARGVWWVPVSSLGGTDMGSGDAARLLRRSPEEKQSAVATLYEALQLFQQGGFRDAEDKIYVEEDGILWEHHKPGYDAVRTNSGCCATNSNWLAYLLQGDYGETGFLAYSMEDGSGHVLNYIKEGGFWYFIDLTHYRPDFLHKAGVETGNADDYFASDYIAGNLHKADSPDSYIRYCLGSFNEPPGLFFLYSAGNCLPVAAGEAEGKTVVFYPEGFAVSVLYDNQEDSLGYRFITPPRTTPGWDSFPSAF